MASKFEGPAKALIKKHEGVRLKPYYDSEGILTIGWGRNLQQGLSEAEADLLFENDFRKAFNQAAKYTWFHRLTPERKQVIVNMVFNLGARGFSKFRRMIAALDIEDYETARIEMLDSEWKVQVGPRATELADMMYS